MPIPSIEETVFDRVAAVRTEVDVATARRRGSELASRLDFSPGDLAMIATAISEVAHNILFHAGEGEVLLSLVCGPGGRRGIEVVARDRGPGIPDLSLAMQDGWSTANSLGYGLPGAKRLMDEFEIVSGVGTGTTVTMRKWERRAGHGE